MNWLIKKISLFLQNKLILSILFLILGLISGFLIKSYFNISSQEKTEKHKGKYSYINPLLECFSEKSDSPENYKLQKKIEDLISKKTKEGKVSETSVYFRDLANGPWIGINENEKFTPASLLKVPIMVSYYVIAESDPSILKREILIKANFVDSNIPNIKPENQVVVGKKYIVEKLIENMIIESDNLAANTLLANIPNHILNQTFIDLGLDLPTIEEPENYMTVKNYSSFFRVLYNSSYLSKKYSEKALELLAKTKYQQGLVAGLPANTKISHKFGERKNNDINQLHDCGIIYKENKDYLLCIMTRGDDFTELTETIKDLSKLVYENIK